MYNEHGERGSDMTAYANRRSKLQTILRHQGIAGFLVTQNVDLFYFTGSMQNGYLFIPASGEAIFYVKRSFVRAKEEADCRVESIASFREFETQIQQDFPYLIAQSTIKIATEFDVLPTQVYFRLQAVFQSMTFIDGSLFIRELRMIKSPDEIEKIKRAATIVDEAFHASLTKIKVGISEIEWMAVIESELRSRGHLGVMRMRAYNQEIITGMVASGEAAAVPTYFDGPAGGLGLHQAAPQGASQSIIQKNEPILVDIGCCIEGYVIDQTRMVCIGSLSDKLQHAYHLSQQILYETEQSLRPGISCEDVYTQALAIVAESGLQDYFMGYGSDQVKFLGHGIGLEIDEFPVLAKGFKYALQPGMVIAIEPKFSFPGVGVVGIEDTYLITETGFQRLTVTEQKLFAR
jgi:Xaa-Pro aminopeptidase